MKKLFLLSFVCVAAMTLNAQKVYVENFATAPINGNVEGYNNWYVCLKSTDNLGISPKIAEGALFYTGYAGTNIGNVAVLDSAIGVSSSNQRISTRIVKFDNDTLKPVVGQKIYTAFLVNISAHSYRSYRDFFTYEKFSTTTSSTRGRIFAKPNTAGDIFTLTITKNSSTSTDFNESSSISGLSLQTGINHLLVMCYETIDGTNNDKLSLYIDPDLSKTEAEQTNILIAKDNEYTDSNHSDYSLSSGLGINLRQRGTGAQIGGIRVGTSWNSVLLGTGAIYSGISQVEMNSKNIKSIEKSILTNQAGNIKVYNLTGSEILSARTEGKLTTSLLKGLYLVRFVGVDGKVESAKVELK